MMILEKNDIKMNVSNKEQEDFDLLLNNEKENFERNFNKNYSQKFIEEYNLKFFNPAYYVLLFATGNCLFLSILFSLDFNSIPPSYHTPIIAFLAFFGLLFHGLPLLKPIKKLLNKMESKKKKSIDIIKKEVFSNNVPGNYFLKHFINAYGEKAIKKILIDKESITYGDIENYIIKFKETEKINDNRKSKIDKVDQIVKCISSLQ